MDIAFGVVIALALTIRVVSLKLTNIEAGKRLKEADICIHKPCGEKENIDCTSLDATEEDTVSGLVELKQKSACSVVVTGGTEAGHGDFGPISHEHGRTVTIRNGTCLYNYITSHASCKRFVSSFGAVLVACEDDHYNLYSLRSDWEITYFWKELTFLELFTRDPAGYNITDIN